MVLRYPLLSLFTILISVFVSGLQAQCVDIVLADSSFESGVISNYWTQDDGISIVTNPVFDGNYAVCSNAGGVQQQINVLPNTTYVLSCWVKNGLHDFSLRVDRPSSSTIIDTGLVTTNEWELVSMPFFTSSDTTVLVRFYSHGACADLFRVTCSPPTGIGDAPHESTTVRLYPNPALGGSIFQFNRSGNSTYSMELYNALGQPVNQLTTITSSPVFLERKGLPSGVYYYRFLKDGKPVATGNWILR